MLIIFLFFGGYVIGSVPFALISSKVFSLPDPRQYGSGNPGATNVLRSGNKWAAICTLVGDCFKGWFAVWLSLTLNLSPGQAALVGVAALLGHIFSFLLQFKGGKGVATALGVLLAIHPWLALAVLGCWVATALITRYSSLAAMVAAMVAVIAGIVVIDDQLVIAALLMIALILAFTHRENIKRLLRGSESKIGHKNTE